MGFQAPTPIRLLVVGLLVGGACWLVVDVVAGVPGFPFGFFVGIIVAGLLVVGALMG